MRSAAVVMAVVLASFPSWASEPVRQALGPCWTDVPEARQSTPIAVRVVLGDRGEVREVRPEGRIVDDPRRRLIYEAARRALLDPRCTPLARPGQGLGVLYFNAFGLVER